MRLKQFFASAGLCFLLGNAMAQPGTIELGLQGSGGIADIWGNKIANDNRGVEPAYGGAVTVQYNFLDWLALRIEPGFERKGTAVKGTATDGAGNPVKFTQRLIMDYYTLPLLARVSFGKSKRFFVNAGPYAGYLAGYKDFIRMGNIPEMEIKNYSKLQDWDLGISAGAGFRLTLKDHWIVSAEARDNLGLLDISRTSVIDNGAIRNHSLSLLLGVAYKI